MSQGNPTIPQKVSDLKQKILNPSLTSHYLVEITPPPEISGKMSEMGAVYSPQNNMDLLSIPCSEASLPGSSFATIDISNDYRGVSEKHAYRKLYDDNITFTFYVDATSGKEYYAIKFFEGWMNYISNQDFNRMPTPTYDYRIKFPEKYYAKSLIIQKFEKNFGSASNEFKPVPLQYEFYNAFPVNFSSISLSYDGSEILKCVAAFSFSRYRLTKSNYRGSSGGTTADPNAPAIPELNTTTNTTADYLKDTTNRVFDETAPYFEYNPPVNRPTYTDQEIANAVDQERQVQLTGRPPDGGFDLF